MATIIATFVPEIWAREMNFSLKKRLIGMNLTNQDFEGEIAGGGDTVNINRPGGVTVGAYTTRTDITVQTPDATQLQLVIDQQDYFAFDVEDIEKVQANANLIPAYLEEASYALGNDADQHIFSRYASADASNVIAKAAYTKTTIWAALTEAAKLLSLNNVPDEGRWIVLSPHEVTLLTQSTEFTRASQLGDDTVRYGFKGEAAGFMVFQSNNVPVVDDGTDDVRHCVFGHSMAITFANQIVKVETTRRERRFADLVKGLHVYGSKVIKPEALGDLRITVA